MCWKGTSLWFKISPKKVQGKTAPAKCRGQLYLTKDHLFWRLYTFYILALISEVQLMQNGWNRGTPPLCSARSKHSMLATLKRLTRYPNETVAKPASSWSYDKNRHGVIAYANFITLCEIGFTSTHFGSFSFLPKWFQLIDSLHFHPIVPPRSSEQHR